MALALKELFKALEKAGGKKLFRKEADIENLVQKGFQDRPSASAGMNWNEPNGLFMSPDQDTLGSLIKGSGTDRYVAPNVVSHPLPGSRYKEFTDEEWAKKYVGKSSKDITDELKSKYDFVEFNDPNSMNAPYLHQTVQLNPNKAIAKIKTDKGSVYKILGAGGLGLAAGSMFSPSDAEAMPLRKPLKGIFKTFAEGMTSETRLGNEMRKIGQKIPAVSGANDRLVGMPLRGSKISGVYQGADDSRYIHLENGQIFPATKNSLHELAAERGTQQQIQKFGQLDEGARWEQISRSYEMNEAKGIPPRAGGNKPLRVAILEHSLVDRQGMLEGEIADQVLVQSTKSGKWWLWPRVYAEPAEVAGLVKIDRARRTLFTNKEK